MPQLFDTFQGVNGTALAAHTPNVGGPWVSGTAGWQIQSNHAKQMVDAAESHVEVAGKILLAQLIVNLNGIDTNNSLTVKLGSNDDADMMYAVFFGDQTMVFGFKLGGNLVGEMDADRAPWLLDLSVDHTLELLRGPDLVQARVDGQIFASAPRPWAKTLSNQRVTIRGEALNAAPGSVIKQISVG
jgi:hypothetical protein